MSVEMQKSSISNKILVLKDEVEEIRKHIEPRGTGHLHTAIGVLEWRIKQLESVSLERNIS
jgi:hypothetical protein